MPRTFALMAVQRQIAASRSTSPSIRLQHGVVGGLPIVTFTKPPSRLAQTPSLRASIGQVPDEDGGGLLDTDPGGGGGELMDTDVGGGGLLVMVGGFGRVAETRTKKRMLTVRKSGNTALNFEPIGLSFVYSLN